MGKLVQQEQGWCQSGNNGGNCPLCRGGILGNNGGIALVVGWLVVGTQLVLPSWYPVQWVLPSTHLLQDSQLLKYGDVTDSDRKGRQVTNLSNSVKLVSKIQRTLWVVDWDYKNPVYSSIVIIINNITQTWSPTPKLDVKLPYKGGSSLNSSTSAARLVPKKMIHLSIDRMWKCFLWQCWDIKP